MPLFSFPVRFCAVFFCGLSGFSGFSGFSGSDEEESVGDSGEESDDDASLLDDATGFVTFRRGDVMILDLRPPRPRDFPRGPGFRPRVEIGLILRGTGEADFTESSI